MCIAFPSPSECSSTPATTACAGAVCVPACAAQRSICEYVVHGKTRDSNLVSDDESFALLKMGCKVHSETNLHSVCDRVGGLMKINELYLTPQQPALLTPGHCSAQNCLSDTFLLTLPTPSQVRAGQVPWECPAGCREEAGKRWPSSDLLKAALPFCKWGAAAVSLRCPQRRALPSLN